MRSNVEVRKIGRYDPTLNGRYSKYEGYCLSTTLQSDPHLINETREEIVKESALIKTNLIIHSPLKRGIQTANLFNEILKVPTISQKELTEILFSLSDLVTEDEFILHGSSLVRKRFVEKFCEDSLIEKRSEIKDRITHLLFHLNTHELENLLLISHSFFMKILEAHIKDLPVFDQPNILSEMISEDKKTYEYGRGFKFSLNSSNQQNASR